MSFHSHPRSGEGAQCPKPGFKQGSGEGKQRIGHSQAASWTIASAPPNRVEVRPSTILRDFAFPHGALERKADIRVGLTFRLASASDGGERRHGPEWVRRFSVQGGRVGRPVRGLWYHSWVDALKVARKRRMDRSDCENASKRR